MDAAHNKKQWKSDIFWVFVVVFLVPIIVKAFVTELDTALILAVIGGFIFLTETKPSFGLYGIILLPIIGELVRFPFGPESGFLISDVLIPIYLAIWLIRKILLKQEYPKSILLPPLLIFIAIAVLSLIQALFFLEPIEVAVSSFYLIRFVAYAFLYLIVSDIAKSKKARKDIFYALTFSASIIAIAGFVQLQIYPNLTELEEYGWDPHINRLVSTWLDPNFIGGMLAFVSSLILGVTLYTKKLSKKISLTAIFLVLATALFLTYSRSAYLAFAAGLLLISLLKSRKILIIGLIIFLIGLGVSERAQERVGSFAQSINSLIFSTADTPDPTAKLRIQSWTQTTEIIADYPLLGTGYNTLRYVNYNKGFIDDPGNHAASGSDSSLLTIFATTGILGLLAFLWLFAGIIKLSFNNWRNKKSKPFSRGYGLGMLGALLGLFIHSFFVNSLLFPQILIFLWISIGLLENRPFIK